MYNSNPETNCIFDQAGCDNDNTWECLTCHVWFCAYHSHKTTKGENVECFACEACRELLEQEASKGDQIAITELGRRSRIAGRIYRQARGNNKP